MPTHESEQRRRLSPPAARAAPSALPRPLPQPDPSPQSPSSFTSLDRVLDCKIAAPSVVPRRVIGQKRINQKLGQIGRASCRERVEISMVDVSCKKERK